MKRADRTEAASAAYPDGDQVDEDDLVTRGYNSGSSKIGRVLSVNMDKNSKKAPGKIVVAWDNGRSTVCTMSGSQFDVAKLNPHLNLKSARAALSALAAIQKPTPPPVRKPKPKQEPKKVERNNSLRDRARNRFTPRNISKGSLKRKTKPQPAPSWDDGGAIG